MSTKPRPDGCLKTLPQERQDEIADYATDHTITQTVFQHIGILSLEFHVDKLSRPLL